MKITKIDKSWYNSIQYGGSKSNRGIYLNGQTNNRWLLKTNKQKASNNPESRLTIHRQTAISEYIASCLAYEVLDLHQEVTILLNENDELCVACRDFTKPQESIITMADNSSRDTKAERFFVNDYDLYIQPVLLSRVPNDIVAELKKHYFQMCVFDYIIANPDRHLGNWGYIINRETGDTRVCPAFDFGAGLGSQLRIYTDNIKQIVDSKDTEILTNQYQVFNNVGISIETIFNNGLPNEFYSEITRISNKLDTLQSKCKELTDKFRDAGFVQNIRLDLIDEIVKYRCNVLRRYLHLNSNNLTGISKLNNISKR